MRRGRAAALDRAVARGMGWIDQDAIQTHWYMAIDVDKLDQVDPHRCVLGQLYPDSFYGAMRRAVRPLPGPITVTIRAQEAWAARHGFYLTEPRGLPWLWFRFRAEAHYRDLTRRWRIALRARQEAYQATDTRWQATG